MNTPELIRRKREGEELLPQEIQFLIDGYVSGEIPDYQISALLMAIFYKGMSANEAAALTKSMLKSGDTYDHSDIDAPVLDKHSTGGVGDKVSLILAPLVAEFGGVVPMVSGRGLGHSGGTLDKLDSIPGYRWNLNEEELKAQLKKVGCAIIGQTDRFVPADKKLYALRDVTATVESIPLISASILSKKRAAGNDYLTMDVKCGSGAFMDSEEKASALAHSLINIGNALGMKVSAILTQMSQPLGVAVGNALEVREAIDVLRGEGPSDTRIVTLELCADMLVLSGLIDERETALEQLEKALDTGKAAERFQKWIESQGGNATILDKPEMLDVSAQTEVFKSEQEGVISRMDTRAVGLAANTLGAGRLKTSDKVDTTVGLTVHKKPGERIEPGDAVFTLYHRDGKNLEEARALLKEALIIDESETKTLPLIIKRVS